MTRNPAARLLARAVFVAIVALGMDLLACGGLSVLEARGVAYQPILGDRLSAENRQAIEDFLGGRESPYQLDSVLGWTLRPRFRSPELAVDAVGRRRAPDRPPPESNAVRLAAFGDSFIFGGDVVDRDAFPEALARLDQGIDIVNYGVPAYGLDQAFLRYLKERRAARPQVVIIGYLSENICRNVSVFRPFYNPTTVFPLAKPRYLLGGRGLRLLRNPLPTPESYRRLLANPADSLAELGRHDAYYRTRPRAKPWDRSATVRLVKLAAAQWSPKNRDRCYGADEAFSVTTRLFSLFYETALRDGAQPVILIFPTREEVTNWRSGRRKNYAPLLSFLGGKGYRVVDAMEVFDGAGRNLSIDELIPSHLSPLANTLVAELLRQRLQSFSLIRGTGVPG
ncbi:MAG TPA: SGNH/GDSL hydrolase family protein [Thermoanaerobaculia bacterium]|nr:SGNH/GDSL hydrolase family protein [Thermoanaerobaculia bacterium]